MYFGEYKGIMVLHIHTHIHTLQGVQKNNDLTNDEAWWSIATAQGAIDGKKDKNLLFVKATLGFS